LFRSAAQNQGQAGLAHAPQPEYIPEHIMQNLPESVTLSTVTPKAPVQSVKDVLTGNGAAEVQKRPKLVVEKTQTTPESLVDPATVPAYHRSSKFDRVPYWQKIGRWKGITESQFLSYRWGVSKILC
jgi:lysine 2,3-aminomutase